MNDYVLYGKGTLKEALFGVGYGIWMTKEFASLIEWIKRYNSNKNYEEKIRFYGFDMNNPSLSAKKVKKFLKQKGKATKLSDKGLDWFIEGRSIYKDYKSKKDTIRLFVKELNNAFNEIDNKIEKEYKLVEHSKRILEQTIEMILANSAEKVLLRDKFMAENIEWIYNFENKPKTILWAHNEHIINNNNKKEQKPMGYYLKEKFSNEYYSFGFGFYKGANCTYSRTERDFIVNNIPDISIKKSTDAIFNQCVYSNFILDFNSVGNNEIITKFLNAKLFHRAIGAIYYPEKNKMRNYKKSKLIESFDGIIFFRETNPSNMIINW
jgi:erythromycin esterase